MAASSRSVSRRPAPLGVLAGVEAHPEHDGVDDAAEVPGQPLERRWIFGVSQDQRWIDGRGETPTLLDGVGISINRWEPRNVPHTLQIGLIDSVQVIHNIFDQAPEDELFPACRELDVAVIARVFSTKAP